MKGIYYYIKHYTLNGFYAYVLFGFYAVTISPFISRFIEFGEPSLAVGVFGFIILIAELFAIYFKLKMVRIRTEQKRLAYKEETGKTIIARPAPFVFFGFFMRIALRTIVLMVSITALGYEATETMMSPVGLKVLMAGLFIDFCWMGYVYMNAGFFKDDAYTRKEWMEIERETEAWNKRHLHLAASPKYYWAELISDIILQLYAIMLFTAYWSHINNLGMDMIDGSLYHGESAFTAAINVFSMQFFVTLMALMPMRIAYWLEDSILAFRTKEKITMWIIFFIVLIYTCIPTIFKFIAAYILKSPDAANFHTTGTMNMILSLLLLVIVLAIQLLMFGKEMRRDQVAISGEGVE